MTEEYLHKIMDIQDRLADAEFKKAFLGDWPERYQVIWDEEKGTLKREPIKDKDFYI